MAVFSVFGQKNGLGPLGVKWENFIPIVGKNIHQQ